MGDEAHVGFVDAHAECDRRDHDHVFGGDERGLIGGADFGRESGVIGKNRAPGRAQLVGKLFDARAGRGIDDARSRLPFDQPRDLAQWIVARRDRIADIGPVEPGDDKAIGRNAELIENVGAGMGIGRRGQGKAGNRGKLSSSGRSRR
jgi:hypothetical protein